MQYIHSFLSYQTFRDNQFFIMAFLSFIFYLFLGLWLFGIISRWLLKAWILKKQRQMQEQMDKNGGQGQPFTGGFFSFGPGGARFGSYGNPGSGPSSPENKKPEGEITIETTEEPKTQVNKKIGEYVDFEEIK